jgi:hypothetical protein
MDNNVKLVKNTEIHKIVGANNIFEEITACRMKWQDHKMHGAR